jgi:hypothetical protein
MGILEAAKPAVVICTRERECATTFYRDILGLALDHEDNLAAVFNVGGITLRISTVADFSPHEHTILGFCVPDVLSTVRALREKGRDLQCLSALPAERTRHPDSAWR